MTRITVSLRETEKTALRVLAESEFRDPRAQAAMIIRQELERRGLLAENLSAGQQAQAQKCEPAKEQNADQPTK